MSRLSDLTKNMATMSEEELLAHVQSIRNNKYVAKPAVKKRVEDVAKKEKNTAIRGVGKALDSMTAQQKLDLLKLLEGDEGEPNG